MSIAGSRFEVVHSDAPDFRVGEGGRVAQQLTSLAGLLAFIGRSPETEMARASTAAAKDKEDRDGKT